jgi:hypothetical protein
MKQSVDAARRLNLLAGRIMMVLAVAHLLLFTGVALWSGYLAGWVSGELRSLYLFTAFETTPSHASFWGGIGGVPIPLLLCGAIVVTLAKAGLAVPRYVGYGLGAWVVVVALILEPSGFPLALLPVGLLIAAQRHERKSTATPTPATSR